MVLARALLPALNSGKFAVIGALDFGSRRPRGGTTSGRRCAARKGQVHLLGADSPRDLGSAALWAHLHLRCGRRHYDQPVWLDYLDTWFTPDTRYTSETDSAAEMEDSQVELRQVVVLPQEEWDSLDGEDGRVVAVAGGQIVFVPVTDDSSGDMSIGTGDVTLTYTRSDGSGGETSYGEQVRVSVQVLCGPGSVPTPDTEQQAGDACHSCRIVVIGTIPNR